MKDTLDQLVQKENENGLVSFRVAMRIHFGSSLTMLQETSGKIISLENWRKNICQSSEEVRVSNRYSFPRSVAVCDIRSTWDISDDWLRKGITTNKMFRGSALSRIQHLTGAVLFASSNGRTVYLGASRVEAIATVKRKLETLARFFVSYDSALPSY